MKKGMIKTGVGILVLVLGLSLAKDLLARISVEQGVRFATGLPLNIRSFHIGLLETVVKVENLLAFNPPGYPEKVMADIPEIYVDYGLRDLSKGKVHLEEMRLHLRELVVVKNRQGEVNLNALKVARAPRSQAPPPSQPQKKGKAPKVEIDRLELKIGKVVFKDYSRGGAPSVREFNINFHERVENLTGVESLVSLIIMKALMHTTLDQLANFDLERLPGTLSHSLQSIQTFAPEVGTKTQEAFQRAAEEAPGLAKETTEALKKRASLLKDRLKERFFE